MDRMIMVATETRVGVCQCVETVPKMSLMNRDVSSKTCAESTGGRFAGLTAINTNLNLNRIPTLTLIQIPRQAVQDGQKPAEH